MSLFSAINTAISGLTAQSTAFGNISEDVANSQTAGFKRVDTSFIDYLTTSTATDNEPGCRGRPPELCQQRSGLDHPDRQSAGHGYRRPGLLRRVAATGRSTAYPRSIRSSSTPAPATSP